MKAVSNVYSLVTTNSVKRIYSVIPQQTAFPYIKVSISSQPFDTKDSTGMQHKVRVQAFSRTSSLDEALNIRSAVIDALERQESNITITGFSLVRFDKGALSDIITEEDGVTRQAIVEFDVVTDN